MVSEITKGIKVSVISKYEIEHSNPNQDKYVHSYQITIDNNSNRTVQLISREWLIVDSHLVFNQIKGKGVIGQQPVLGPGHSHSYSSWTPLKTAVGKMMGYYTMLDLMSNQTFDINVPAFVLCTDELMN